MQRPSLVDSARPRLICSYGDLEIIRWSEPTVKMNLAVDEQLAQCAARTGRRIIRLWWGSSPTAVLGCGDKPDIALDLDKCEQLGIGWVKRVTGGGTVLQTSGVFNYSYTAPGCGRLDIARVFGQGVELVVRVLAQFGINAEHRGISDVTVGDLKISGNAQARKWKAVLLHGTLLVDIDRELMGVVLRHPHREPEYRRGRAHGEFIVTLSDLGVSADGRFLENAFAAAAVEVFGHKRRE